MRIIFISNYVFFFIPNLSFYTNEPIIKKRMDGPTDPSNQPDHDRQMRLGEWGWSGSVLPRSPPRLAEEQSEWLAAKSVKVAGLRALVLDKDVQREPSYLIRVCDARTISPLPATDDMVVPFSVATSL